MIDLNSETLPKNVRVFGRDPAKKVAVLLEPSSDPKKMMEGMEEYFFKSVQAMNFGKPKTMNENLYLAVLQQESMMYRIFHHNLDQKVSDIIAETGVDPKERKNEQLEEEKEKKQKVQEAE